MAAAPRTCVSRSGGSMESGTSVDPRPRVVRLRAGAAIVDSVSSNPLNACRVFADTPRACSSASRLIRTDSCGQQSPAQRETSFPAARTRMHCARAEVRLCGDLRPSRQLQNLLESRRTVEVFCGLGKSKVASRAPPSSVGDLTTGVRPGCSLDLAWPGLTAPPARARPVGRSVEHPG